MSAKEICTRTAVSCVLGQKYDTAVGHFPFCKKPSLHRRDLLAAANDDLLHPSELDVCTRIFCLDLMYHSTGGHRGTL